MITVNPIIRKLDADAREGIIGSSSVGAIAGLPGYVSEYRVWRDFMGFRDKPDDDTQWTYDKGHILEESIAELFTKRTGIELRKSDAYIDPDHPELICHPDRIAAETIDGKVIAVECKTAGTYSIRKGGWEAAEPVMIPYVDGAEVLDGRSLPPQYYAQCQWYYAICGFDAVFLARLTDNELYIYYVPEDERFGKELYSGALEWIEAVRSGYIPEITDPREIRIAYPRETPGTATMIDDETMRIYTALLDAEKRRKEAADEEQDLKLKLGEKMKDAEILVGRDGKKLLTWKTETRLTFDAKRFRAEFPDIASDYLTESSYRVMKLAKSRTR